MLRRAEFAPRVAALPAQRGWPTDEDEDGVAGPAGGAALRDTLGADSLQGRPLNAVAVDAVWVALSGGSSYLSPQVASRTHCGYAPRGCADCGYHFITMAIIAVAAMLNVGRRTSPPQELTRQLSRWRPAPDEVGGIRHIITGSTACGYRLHFVRLQAVLHVVAIACGLMLGKCHARTVHVRCTHHCQRHGSFGVQTLELFCSLSRQMDRQADRRVSAGHV